QAIGEHRRPRAARPAADVAHAERRAVGHRELPGNADRADATGTARIRPRRRDRPRLRGYRRELRGRDRLPLRPAASGERERQLRQGRPAHSGAHQARARTAGDGTPASRHVGRAQGPSAMTPKEAAAISPEESLRITHEQGWTGGHNPWVVALVVTMATFMEVLDTAIANVSLSHIAGSLSVSSDEATWVLTSYLVSNAVVLPISGWLATRIGRKRFYLTCVFLFTGSSFLCGLAPNLGMLIFFRVLQGVGGGGLQPSEQAILADTFPPQKRGMAFAIYGMAVVLAPAIGPTLGGYITDHTSWRWIFFLNVPVGMLSLFLSHHVVEDPPWVRARGRAIRIDYIGLSLIVVGLG